jgi:Cys-tRNA(Pro)/Cys-tRNA(Cys) deacylase
LSPEIRSFLEGCAASYAVHQHTPVISFEDAKHVLPFDPVTMVKSLAFRLPGGGYGLAALRAVDRADYKKIADNLGVRRADLKLASGGEIAGELGMTPGGVAPLPINGATVVMDHRAAALTTIFCGTGRNDATLEIAVAELIRISGATVTDLAKPT